MREIFRTKNLLFGEKFMYFKKFEDLTFADHYMFEKVLQNAEICQELLERLLKIKIDHLEYPEIEKTISPYYETKGVRLDVYVKDSDKVFDIELQNSADNVLSFLSVTTIQLVIIFLPTLTKLVALKIPNGL